MNMKNWGVALSLTAAFGLMACGDSSSNSNGGDMPSCKTSSNANSASVTISSGGASQTTVYTVDGNFMVSTTTFKGLPNGVIEDECETAKLEAGAQVTCDGNKITTKIDMGKEIAVSDLKTQADLTCRAMEGDYEDDDFNEPSSVRGGDKDDRQNVVYDNDDPEVVDDGSEGGNSDPVNPPETNPDPNTTVDDLIGSYGQPCSVEGQKKNDVVFGVNVPMICKDGAWDSDDDAMEEMWSCSVEGATKDTVIAGISMTLTCDEGEWTMDDSSSEEMLKCDQEGAKSTLMGLPVICKDGEWEVDEDSMDWGDWDDGDIIVD